MYIPQHVDLPASLDSKTTTPISTFRNLARDQPSVEGVVSGADANTQSFLNPNDQGSMILGITFFGVVPMAACFAYIVVKIFKLRERKRQERLGMMGENAKRNPDTPPEPGFQGKPELDTDTARHEIHGEDLRHEMAVEGTTHGMDGMDGKDALPELQAGVDGLRGISPRTRQELKGEEISTELEVPEQQHAGKRENCSMV